MLNHPWYRAIKSFIWRTKPHYRDNNTKINEIWWNFFSPKKCFSLELCNWYNTNFEWNFLYLVDLSVFKPWCFEARKGQLLGFLFLQRSILKKFFWVMWCNDLWDKFSGKIIYLYRYKRFFPYLTLDSDGIERGNNGGSIFFTQKYADKWPTLFRKKRENSN